MRFFVKSHDSIKSVVPNLRVGTFPSGHKNKSVGSQDDLWDSKKKKFYVFCLLKIIEIKQSEKI